jgi:putative intracellular protease/amidase
VGTDGRLGGQAEVKGVAGGWRDLTDSVNSMAGNLANQVRWFAKCYDPLSGRGTTKKPPVTRKAFIAAGFAVVVILAVRMGFPELLRAGGLHPYYYGPKYELPGGRALIVTTSHARLNGTGARTGVFASEMTAPYYAFRDGGMTVDVASVEGGEIPIDPMSFRWYIETSSDKRFRQDAQFRDQVQHSRKINDVDFTQYDIIFLAGGWGAAYDLGFSDVLGRKITDAWRARKVLGGICHGPLGLLRAKDEAGLSLVTGKHVTAVTDKQGRELGISGTPQHPERELRAAGARFESKSAFRDFFANHVVADGRLVTGQNQNAGTEAAEEMMRIAGAGRISGNTK